MKKRSFLRDIGRAISWHRRKLAILAAVAAVLTAINAASPQPAPTTVVVRSAKPLPGGITLQQSDLETFALDRAALPDQAIADPAALVGQTLAAPVSAGQVLTEIDMLRSRGQLRPGHVMAPLRVTDPDLVALLRVGDRLDVLAAEPQGGTAQVIAERARVVTIAASPPASGGITGGASGTERLVLLEVDPETAALLAQAAVSAETSIVLR